MNHNVVKHGDTHTITFLVNADLTGSTLTKVLAKKGSVTTELTDSCEITDASGGKVTHTLSGELAPGHYNIEIEFKDIADKIYTAPTEGYADLWVYRDLG